MNSAEPFTSGWKSTKLSKLFYAEGGAVGDLDGDGHHDLIAGPLLYFGPDFSQSVPLDQVGPHSINGYSQHFFSFVSDVDRDGHPDVVTVGFPGEAGHWHRNPGGREARGGNWEKFVTLASIDNESPMFADIDGDGLPELVCCHGGNFGYAKPSEQPTAPWKFYPVQKDGTHQRFTHGIGIGDVDDDGLIDILSKDGWWKQPKEKTDAPWEFTPFPFSGPGGAQMYAVDLDGDGKAEVVTSLAAHSYGFVVYKKNLDGSDWQKIDIMTDSAATSPTGLAISQLHAVEIADMDQDGKPDIVTGKRFWAHQGNDPGENEPVYLVWFKPVSTSAGLRFIPNLVDDDSGVGTQIAVADINKDGLQDIFSVSKRGIHVLTQLSASDAPSGKSVPPEVAKQSIAIDDELGGFRPAWSPEQAMNLDFESGDIRDWTATGGAFFNQPVQGDVVHARRADSHSKHQGEFWVGSFETTGDISTGLMTSAPFVLSKPWVAYLQGGGQSNQSRIEIVAVDGEEVLATTHGLDSEEMKYSVLHLPKAVGKSVFIRLVDEGKGGWGHVNFDDFRLFDSKPSIPEDRLIPAKDAITYKSLSPDKVAGAMTLPEGFQVQVIASEPQVRQPIAMTIDAKGRVWVAEAYQYPLRAEGEAGKDRVLIFEDSDGDGTLDKSKVFVDNLNLVSGIEVGMGGLWVGAAPYLLFIPDLNGDDVPDGPAIKKLSGWGYQDTHETLNSFIWGPDGWLYGCHGVFTHSEVRVVRKDGSIDESKPGTKINAGIWRYRPQSETFEVFAHGTSNPWGVDFNDNGDAFLTACVIPHLFHIIPEARYQRQAGIHFNPFTYADIPTIAVHRHWTGANPHAGNNRSDSDGGGHAHSGAMFYLGGSWPEKYRNQLFMNNIHGARLNQDEIAEQGSGYVGNRAPDFLMANDQSSQILYFRSGPDGQVIAIDWYDAQQCHVVDPTQHDQSNGRIYRISYGAAPSVQVDLEKCSDQELVDFQSNQNDWFVRTARRVLMEREQAKGLPQPTKRAIRKLLSDDQPRIRLRGLWALAAIGDVHVDDLDRLLADKSDRVRGWAIRMISQWADVAAQDQRLDDAIWGQLAERAKHDDSQVVRLELASLAQRSELERAVPIVSGLILHSQDASDHNLPLMVWYAVSRILQQQPEQSQAIQRATKIPLVSQFASRQLTQMWMEKPELADLFLQWVANCLEQDDPTLVASQLDAVLFALEGKRSVAPPNGWSRVANSLLNHPDANVRQRGVQLATKLNDESAMQTLAATAQDTNASVDERIAAINVLKQIRARNVSEIAFSMLSQSELRAAALSAIADSVDPSNAGKLIEIACRWDSRGDRRQAWFALLRRPTTALELLNRVAAGKISSEELTAEMVQQIVQLDSPEVQTVLKEVWGEARALDADKKEAADKIRAILEAEETEPQLEQGKAVFSKICGQCHVLFGEGGKIGPELTGSNRRDLNYLLENILDPSAVMAKEYQPWIVRTVDEQVLTGLLKGGDANSIKLQTATDEVIVYNDDIDQKKQSETSMMPNDLLSPLSHEEIRALFDYLRSER